MSFSVHEKKVNFRFSIWWRPDKGEWLDPVAMCVKICRVCKQIYKTQAHAQKTCDDCKEKQKAEDRRNKKRKL